MGSKLNFNNNIYKLFCFKLIKILVLIKNTVMNIVMTKVFNFRDRI